MEFKIWDSLKKEKHQHVFHNTAIQRRKKLSFLLNNARFYMQISSNSRKMLQKIRMEIASQNTIRNPHKRIKFMYF